MKNTIHSRLGKCAVRLGMLLAVMLAGCAEKSLEIPGKGPVDRFKKQAHWIYVYSKRGVEDNVLYTADRLSSFVPGLSLSVARGMYGQPKTEIPEERGARYLIYETTSGIIKLGSETTADGYTSYPMYFVPNDRKPSAFFCAEIVEQIDTAAAKQVVMLFDPGCTKPFLHAKVEYGQIQEVVFIPRAETK